MNNTVIEDAALLDFTSEDTKQILTFVTLEILQPPLLILGIITNLINIIVYLQLRLKDSITICFFVLSCTDLVCVLLAMTASACTSLSFLLEDVLNTDGANLTFLTISYYSPFYDISQGITTFIAVQKCWCVALPFRFKNTFTTGRTVVILTAISMAVAAMHLPILATQGLVEVLNPVSNRTQLQLWIPEISGKLYSAVGLVSLLFTNTCQLTVVFCLIVLASKLRASSKFRRSTKIANNEQPPSGSSAHTTKLPNQNLSVDTKCEKILYATQSMYVQENSTGKKRHGIRSAVKEDNTSVPRAVKTSSQKELMAIKSTTFVSILFVIFNTFKLLHYYTLLCTSDYSIYGRHRNTYWVTNEMRFTLEVLHCSCNMFVYIKFNSRFRSTLLAGSLGRR